MIACIIGVYLIDLITERTEDLSHGAWFGSPPFSRMGATQLMPRHSELVRKTLVRVLFVMKHFEAIS